MLVRITFQSAVVLANTAPMSVLSVTPMCCKRSSRLRNRKAFEIITALPSAPAPGAGSYQPIRSGEQTRSPRTACRGTG